jgi:hypothetical protein
MQVRGARPIINKEINDHYLSYNHSMIDFPDYQNTFYEWIIAPYDKNIIGLNEFNYVDYIQGTSQAFDHFVLRNATKQLVNFVGDFQYHKCISKHINYKILYDTNELTNNQSLIISFPFSDTGNEHIQFNKLLDKCEKLHIPVCLDIAYWGISKNLTLNLNKWSCIQEVVCSLSKSFYVLETHRVGIRYSRSYADDGISMLNEVGMINQHSMSLGVWFMKKFDNSYNWKKYAESYSIVCTKLNLQPTNTVIFGIGGDEYSDYNRGILGNNRVCISNNLLEI